MKPRTRFIAAVAVAALAVSVGVYAGIANRGINQFPVAPNFARRVLPIHISGFAVTGNRTKDFYLKNRIGDCVITNVSAIVRVMSGTIAAFTAQLTVNDLASLTSAIDMYSTGLASAGTIHAGTLINSPTVWKSGQPLGVNIVFTGTNTPTATDIDLEVEYRPFVGQEY